MRARMWRSVGCVSTCVCVCVGGCACVCAHVCLCTCGVWVECVCVCVYRCLCEWVQVCIISHTPVLPIRSEKLLIETRKAASLMLIWHSEAKEGR